MSHTVIITTPPSDGGGGSLVAESPVKVTVEYSPPHDLSPEQEHRNIEKIERRSARFYEKLLQLLADPEADGE